MSVELVSFCKALADTNRIRILGLLAQKAYSVEELAALLDLKPSTVSHHLAKLTGVGLVGARAFSYYNIYEMDTKALEHKARTLFSEASLTASTTDVDVTAYDQKVIRDYSRRDGRLKTIPAQHKKLEAILRHVVRSFDAKKRYSEKRVNEILRRYHGDTASLRRELVENGFMKREGGCGEYWRTDRTLDE